MSKREHELEDDDAHVRARDDDTEWEVMHGWRTPRDFSFEAHDDLFPYAVGERLESG